MYYSVWTESSRRIGTISFLFLKPLCYSISLAHWNVLSAVPEILLYFGWILLLCLSEHAPSSESYSYTCKYAKFSTVVTFFSSYCPAYDLCPYSSKLPLFILPDVSYIRLMFCIRSFLCHSFSNLSWSGAEFRNGVLNWFLFYFVWFFLFFWYHCLTKSLMVVFSSSYSFALNHCSHWCFFFFFESIQWIWTIISVIMSTSHLLKQFLRIFLRSIREKQEGKT